MTPMTTSSARSAPGKSLSSEGHATPDELANCVRAVHSGRNYVSATIGAKLAAQAATRTPAYLSANWTWSAHRSGCSNKEITIALVSRKAQ